jgi:hypothetical protein
MAVVDALRQGEGPNGTVENPDVVQDVAVER